MLDLTLIFVMPERFVNHEELPVLPPGSEGVEVVFSDRDEVAGEVSRVYGAHLVNEYSDTSKGLDCRLAVAAVYDQATAKSHLGREVSGSHFVVDFEAEEGLMQKLELAVDRREDNGRNIKVFFGEEMQGDEGRVERFLSQKLTSFLGLSVVERARGTKLQIFTKDARDAAMARMLKDFLEEDKEEVLCGVDVVSLYAMRTLATELVSDSRFGDVEMNVDFEAGVGRLRVKKNALPAVIMLKGKPSYQMPVPDKFTFTLGTSRG